MRDRTFRGSIGLVLCAVGAAAVWGCGMAFFVVGAAIFADAVINRD
jgi:hypothetical protein